MLKLSLEALQIIDAIDRRGSFAKAGQELHRVTSAISYVVNKLEDDLKVEVFTRHGSRIALTPAGRELLDEGRLLLRAAGELEQRVRRVQSGWETELGICLDSMFRPEALLDTMRASCAMAPQTRLRFSSETLDGAWEALLDRRTDLLVGVTGDGPAGGGYAVRAIGSLDFVFAVAPSHPLAKVEGPLGRAQLQDYRAIVVADSARHSAPRSVGLLMEQDTLTVPDMAAKLQLQLAGMGFGFLPAQCARGAIDRGLLVEKEVEVPRGAEKVSVAWRTGEEGVALRWWREHMLAEGIMDKLVASMPTAVEGMLACTN